MYAVNNKNYRQVNGYEVHPTDIVNCILSLAGLEDGNGKEYERTKEELTEVLYHLDAVCMNENNKDHFRTLYRLLAIISEEIEL